jgi:hypothetical protein
MQVIFTSKKISNYNPNTTDVDLNPDTSSVKVSRDLSMGRDFTSSVKVSRDLPMGRD